MGSESVALRAAALFQSDFLSLDYESLLAAVQSIVPLDIQPITIANTEFLWHSVADPDRLLNEAVENGDSPAAEIDPFWSVAWRAAQGMDAYLERLDLNGKRLLELGAGAGHAGLAAAARGALVTLTDAVDLALLVARLNSWPVRQNVAIARLRWGNDRLDVPGFPIILGSDLVYDPSHFPQLERCAREHLSSGGQWLLSEPNRHTGDKFAGWIEKAGWQCESVQLPIDVGRVPIRIFRCRL